MWYSVWTRPLWKWRVASGNMLEADVAREGAEERDSVANEHGNPRDDEPLDEARGQEPLDGDAAVNIKVLGAASGESRKDVRRRPGHLLHDATDDGG